ncbi:MAG: diguanylate cyclase domain-containing protein, partial [Gammaproteobacteria bacterium]
MTDELRRSHEDIEQEPGGFMTIIEALTNFGASESSDKDDAPAEANAMLVCRDRSVQKWGVRWLQRAGFRTTVISDPDDACASIDTIAPDVIVVEAWLKSGRREPVFRQLLESASPDVPVFVLSTSTTETKSALDAGAFDVARKPFDWQLLSRRARAASKQARREAALAKTRESLESARAVADQAKEKLRTSESFEPVTGLPNRTKFHDLLRRGIKSVSGGQNTLLAMVVGLNRFNQIAEALGQRKSDQVASMTAQTLTECLQIVADATTLDQGLRTASVGRIAPGRFAVMMTCAPDSDEVDVLRRIAIDRLSLPVVVDGQTLYLSPCVGAALYPRDTSDAAQLLLKAESAMRDARANGLQFRYHATNLEADVARKLQIEHRLHRAIEKSELQLAYQPLVDVSSDKIVGCEALLRWPQG